MVCLGFSRSQTSIQNQLCLLDRRASEIVLRLTWNQNNLSPSKFTVPNWSQSGLQISCGSMEPLLNLWDIRYNKIGLPSQTIALHKKRIFQGSFIPNRLVTISSDKTVGIHSYLPF